MRYALLNCNRIAEGREKEALSGSLFRAFQIAFLFFALFIKHDPVFLLDREFDRLSFSEAWLIRSFLKDVTGVCRLNRIREEIVIGDRTAGSRAGGRHGWTFHFSPVVHLNDFSVHPIPFLLRYGRSHDQRHDQ